MLMVRIGTNCDELVILQIALNQQNGPGFSSSLYFLYIYLVVI